MRPDSSCATPIRPNPRTIMAIPFDFSFAHLLTMTASVIAGAVFADSVETSGRRIVERALRFLGLGR
ncbi:hypothetical protein GMJLKIPL_1460 [Methylobacterium isbiliense]|uniref:Uncharacterized protein n=1 Tax=Methylobacterium isbiliense TaxID=315478 RepID=A0ABQ4SBM1_9HYPH|nr:hypothetical protein GMJLKIPL_1460 [Methylobacterium isbiliense]